MAEDQQQTAAAEKSAAEKAQIGKMAPPDPAFWLLREMITNESLTGRGANAAILALIARGIYGAGPTARLMLGGIAGVAAAGGYSLAFTGPASKLAAQKHLWSPVDEGGFKVIVENRTRLNEWLYECALRAGNGVVGSTFRLGPSLVISSPSVVKHVLKDNFPNYEKGKKFRTAFNDMPGDGIFNTNGPRWKTQVGVCF